MKINIKNELIKIIILLIIIIPTSIKAEILPTPESIMATQESPSSIKISFNKVKGATGYRIFLYNDKIRRYKFLKELDKNTTEYVHKNLDSNITYSYKLTAINKDKKEESKISYWVKAKTYPDSSSYGNLKDMNFINKVDSLVLGDPFQYKMSFTADKSGKIANSKDLRWWTSNSSIASIDSVGKITSYKPGTVTVYVKGHNGVTKETKLVIKEKKIPLVDINIVPTPKNIKVENISSKENKISWDKVEDAKYYEVYHRDAEGNYKLLDRVKKNYYKHSVPTPNIAYTYRIKTIKKMNNKEEKSKMSYWVSTYANNKKSTRTNISRIRIKNANKFLIEGEEEQFKVKVRLDDKNKMFNRTLRWWTSNKEVATIDEHGLLKPIKPGYTKVYVRTANGLKASKNIRVLTSKATRIPILTFHRITTDKSKKKNYKDNQWIASIDDFERELKYLHDNKYNVISLEEFEKWYDEKIELPSKTVALTFDDGDYGQYYLAYRVIKKYNMKATSFVICSLVKDNTELFDDKRTKSVGKDVIASIEEEYPNMEFQSHSYNLHYKSIEQKPIILSKTYQELDQDYKESKKFGFDYMAYPYGIYTQEAIKAAEANNMRMVFIFGTDTFATRNDGRYEIPRVKINGQITYNDFVNKMESYLE